MILIRPTPRAEMEANWERVRRAPAPQRPKPQRPALNLRAVLDLGNIIFFTFRGRAYGIPPLPWRHGEEILAAWQRMEALGETITPENREQYYASIDQLQRLLWRAIRPTGRVARLRYRLGLHPNPFRLATEGEIVALARFLLGLRMSDGALTLMGPQGGGT